MAVAYLTTRSARTNTFGGIVRPIRLAAFRLTMNSGSTQAQAALGLICHGRLPGVRRGFAYGDFGGQGHAMTILHAMEKAKRLHRERESTSQSNQPRRIVAPSDTGLLKVLDEGTNVAVAGPAIGGLGRVHYDPDSCVRNRILYTDELLAAEARGAAAYRLLRGRVLQRARAKDWSCLGITSPGPGEGKTVTTVNLALDRTRAAAHRLLAIQLSFALFMADPKCFIAIILMVEASVGRAVRGQSMT